MGTIFGPIRQGREPYGLYEILGVSPDADKEEIRRAFRSAAFASHPDRPGGDPERFKAVRDAWAILSDDAAREHYDRTGEASPPRDYTEQAKQVIVQTMYGMLDHLKQTLRPPSRVDLIGQLRGSIQGSIRQFEQQIGQLENKIATAESVAERLGDSWLADAARHRAEQPKKQLEATREKIATGKKAIEMLKGESYRFDSGFSPGQGFPVNMDELMRRYQ